MTEEERLASLAEAKRLRTVLGVTAEAELRELLDCVTREYVISRSVCGSDPSLARQEAVTEAVFKFEVGT